MMPVVKTSEMQILKKKMQEESIPWKIHIVTNTIFFTIGLLISGKSIYEKFFPFGIALVTGVPYKNLILSSVASSLSYLITNDISYSIKYVATVFAICAVRWLLKDIKLSHKCLCNSIMCSLINFFMSFPVYMHGDSSFYILTDIFIESALAGSCSFLFEKSINITLKYFKTKSKTKFLVRNTSDLLIISSSIFVVTFSLSDFNLGPISLGNAISTYILFLICRAGGTLCAGVSFIILNFISGFKPSSINTYVSNYYNFSVPAICMLVVGLFPKHSKIKVSILYIFLNLILKLYFFSEINIGIIISSLYESILSCTLLLITPDNILNKLINFNCNDEFKANNLYCIQQRLSLNLKYLSESFKNIGSGLDVVSMKKEANKNTDLRELLEKTNEKFCSVCSLSTFCWGSNKNNTINYLNNILKKRENNLMHENEFSSICPSVEKIRKYYEYLNMEKSIKDIAQIKVNEMKDYVVEQFKDTGSILSNLSEKINNSFNYNLNVSDKILNILRKNNINCYYAFCKDYFDKKWSIEISVDTSDKQKFENLRIEDILKNEYGKIFNSPILINNYKKSFKYIILEKTNYTVRVDVAQHVCKNGDFCGDSYKYFFTEDGKLVIILSDGMGTGVRAAVEGTLACEILSTLIKSHVDTDIALRITNTTLLTNPNEESLAAIDLVIIDLNTGNSRFIKAGAASSIIKSKNEIKILDEASLPIGILKNIDYSINDIKLKNKDKILIMSDGASYPSNDWIAEKLNSWKGENGDLAKSIIDDSLKKAEQDKDDDITVIAVEILNS